MQLRTDGLVKIDLGYVVAGNLEGQSWGWIIGFNQQLRNCSILKAELWGILDGLILVQEKQRNKVLIQTDSLKAIEAIQD
ncbi:hypothetical protein Gotri_024670 [Gossypium trilobum]|uniref:RNase H type-1 domain-containing protein n=1 Tax=Gossypium trilobum TaxID=34281 RepID=A0A7J9DNI2_9ROSI|nr:hypothetical protein [Gossypium trilobum]